MCSLITEIMVIWEHVAQLQQQMTFSILPVG